MQVNVIKQSLGEADYPITVVGFTEEQAKNPPDLLKKTVDNLVKLGDFTRTQSRVLVIFIPLLT